MDSNKSPVTVRETIADGLQAQIIQAGENISSNLWELGDLVDEAVAEKPPGASNDAVLVNCGLLSGKSSARVNDLRSTSVFYPEDIRDMFPTLTHSHFFVAKAAGDLALSYLQNAEESADEYGGNRIPVGKLGALISEDKRDPDKAPPPVWYKWMRAAYTNAKRIDLNRGKEDIPVGIKEYIEEFIEGLEEDFDGEMFLNGEEESRG